MRVRVRRAMYWRTGVPAYRRDGETERYKVEDRGSAQIKGLYTGEAVHACDEVRHVSRGRRALMLQKKRTWGLLLEKPGGLHQICGSQLA